MDIKEEGERRNNSKDTRVHLEALVLRTKPEANQWLHLTPRVAALGADAFEQGPVMIRKIHAYLVKEVNLAENAEEKAAEFVSRVCQVTLETYWTQKVKGEEGFERTDSMLEGLGAGWTASFLAKVYPKLSRYLIKEFLQAVVEVSIDATPKPGAFDTERTELNLAPMRMRGRAELPEASLILNSVKGRNGRNGRKRMNVADEKHPGTLRL